MYEAEVNEKLGGIEELSPSIRARFCELRDRVAMRTVLPWGEHCTECNWPTCYRTCELYVPRSDGACRQFVDGMVRIDNSGGLSPYILKMRFKQWAKLWTPGNLQLVPWAAAQRKEKSNILIGALVREMPLPAALRGRAQRKVNYLRRCSAETAAPATVVPDYFLAECYNPNERTIVLTFTIRPKSITSIPPFQKAIEVPPGYMAARVDYVEISARVNLRQPFEVEVVPNECDDTILYFGLIDFVKEKERAVEKVVQNSPRARDDGKRPIWKCIVWDLDNTIWDGVLIEDGLNNLRLRQSVVDIIKETDRRGILHSIASKNNPEEAMKMLRVAGIEEYFLHPQISWDPKSQSIAKVAGALNIGLEAIAFVDDQEFEREEVKSALPAVSLIDAAEHASILTRAECDVPVTDESRERRRLYREQEKRKEMEVTFNGNYHNFLRSCGITIEISPLNDANLERVYELAQRTNQMNFSDARYPRERLREMISDPSMRTFVMRCSDRFGSYGIVGFAVIDSREPRLLDLMFSCRVQGKRVEHAFLTYILNAFVSSHGQFHANYRPTVKNAQSGKVFEQMGFEAGGETNGIISLTFRDGRPIPDDNVILIREEGKLI